MSTLGIIIIIILTILILIITLLQWLRAPCPDVPANRFSCCGPNPAPAVRGLRCAHRKWMTKQGKTRLRGRTSARWCLLVLQSTPQAPRVMPHLAVGPRFAQVVITIHPSDCHGNTFLKTSRGGAAPNARGQRPPHWLKCPPRAGGCSLSLFLFLSPSLTLSLRIVSVV